MPWDTSDRRSRLPANWQALRQQVFSRDDRQCQIRDINCTGYATEVDHIIPSGSDEVENLQSACHGCHARKTNREAAAARPSQRRPAEAHPAARRRRPPVEIPPPF